MDRPGSSASPRPRPGGVPVTPGALRNFGRRAWAWGFRLLASAAAPVAWIVFRWTMEPLPQGATVAGRDIEAKRSNILKVDEYRNTQSVHYGGGPGGAHARGKDF